jgi:hypothetical protein
MVYSKETQTKLSKYCYSSNKACSQRDFRKTSDYFTHLKHHAMTGGALNPKLQGLVDTLGISIDGALNTIDRVQSENAGLNRDIEGFRAELVSVRQQLDAKQTELDSKNRRILTDFSYENYDGTNIDLDISEVEYFNSVNHFVFFCFNFPDNFMEAFPSNLRVHLSEKWSDAYNKKGSVGAMIYFWSELDNQNRRKLADWVKKNYTGTKLYEVGGALGDVAGMLPSPLPMSTIQPMAKGGDISADDFIKQVKSMHNNIDEVVLKDGTHIAGKDLMANGGQLKFFADGGEIPKEYEKYLRPYYAVDNMDWEGKVI